MNWALHFIQRIYPDKKFPSSLQIISFIVIFDFSEAKDWGFQLHETKSEILKFFILKARSSLSPKHFFTALQYSM